MRKGSLITFTIVGTLLCLLQSTKAQNLWWWGTGFYKTEASQSKQVHLIEDLLFDKFIKDFDKSYATEHEREMRKQIFLENAHKILNHNNNHKSTYTMAINHLADLLPEEMEKRNGLKIPKVKAKKYQRVIYENDLPKTFDWRDKGAISPVRDLGQMGDFNVYAATASLESAHFIATSKLVNLSQAQIQDCLDNSFWLELIYEYAMTHPIERAEDYQHVHGKCNYDASKGLVKVLKTVHVEPNSIDQLKQAVAASPVVAALHAGEHFIFYSGGIIDTDDCGTDLNHGVMIVGYGTEKGKDYWIAQNFWGVAWGESGYVRIAIKDGKGVCGINQYAFFPITN